VHNLSPIPDDGFQVLPDWASDKLLHTMETKPADWEIRELRRMALSRLYLCPDPAEQHPRPARQRRLIDRHALVRVCQPR